MPYTAVNSIELYIEKKKLNLMKTMKIKFFGLLIISGILVTGCDPAEPAAKGVDLTMNAVSSAQGFNFGFSKIMIGIKDIEFETEAEDLLEKASGESSSEKVEFKGPYAVNLSNGLCDTDFQIGDFTNGTYDEMEIKLGPVLPNGNTITISFAFAFPGMDSIKFEFSTKEEFEIEILQSMDFSTFGGMGGQTFQINDTMNAKWADKFKQSLKGFCSGGEDSDGDGDID
jgi:hypothetical protein